MPFKTCTTCGREFTAEQWAALPTKGHQPSEDETGFYDLELKDCTCGSTIGVETKLPAIDADERKAAEHLLGELLKNLPYRNR